MSGSQELEDIILYNLIQNEDYIRKVFPFLKDEYFSSSSNKILFAEISDFITKYNKKPSIDSLKVEIESSSLEENIYEEVVSKVNELSKKEFNVENEWLFDKTETWCQDRAIHNGIMKAVKLLGDESELKHSIPDILREALSVSFDTSVGHRFFKDAKKRFEFYTSETMRHPFNIEMLNIITNGGVKPKTLNIFIAGTGVGKSICLCHLAASYLLDGKNVLYITLEMSEEETAGRIEANLFDLSTQDVEAFVKNAGARKYLERLKSIYSKTSGEIVVKEFPGGGATHAGHIRYLIKELELKQGFKPDILIIDYLGLAGSSRYKAGGLNHSTYLKSVAEELRGLGQEFDVPVWSAAQFNREGMSNTDADLDDIAESIGITHTADLALAIISTEELDQLGQYQFKQLKNRGNDMNKHRRFKVGVDKSKSRLHNLTFNTIDEVDNSIIDTTVIKHTSKKRDFKSFS